MTSVRRLFVKAAVGACALAGLASSGAYAASPDGMKLYQFSSYWLDIGKSALSSATSGDEKIMPRPPADVWSSPEISVRGRVEAESARRAPDHEAGFQKRREQTAEHR